MCLYLNACRFCCCRVAFLSLFLCLSLIPSLISRLQQHMQRRWRALCRGRRRRRRPVAGKQARCVACFACFSSERTAAAAVESPSCNVFNIMHARYLQSHTHRLCGSSTTGSQSIPVATTPPPSSSSTPVLVVGLAIRASQCCCARW